MINVHKFATGTIHTVNLFDMEYVVSSVTLPCRQYMKCFYVSCICVFFRLFCVISQTKNLCSNNVFLSSFLPLS